MPIMTTNPIKFIGVFALVTALEIVVRRLGLEVACSVVAVGVVEQMDFRKVRVETAMGAAKLKIPKTMAVESAVELMVAQTALIK